MEMAWAAFRFAEHCRPSRQFTGPLNRPTTLGSWFRWRIRRCLVNPPYVTLGRRQTFPSTVRGTELVVTLRDEDATREAADLHRGPHVQLAGGCVAAHVL